MTRKFCLLLLIFSAPLVAAQPPDTLWTHTYGPDAGAHSVQQTPDGGFILAGGYNNSYGYLIKTDAFGDTLWTRLYRHASGCPFYILNVSQAQNGGFLLTGYVYCQGTPLDCWYGYIIKTDETGNPEWTYSIDYGEHYYVHPSCGQQSSDGGYVIAGWGYLTGGYGQHYAYLWKFSANGNPTWTHSWLDYHEAACVRATADGNCIVVGTEHQGDFTQLWLMKITPTGSILWQRLFGGEYYMYEGSWVEQTHDAGYIVVGRKSYGTYDYNFYLMKTDSNGNFVWSLTNNRAEYGYCVQQTPDEGYISVTGEPFNIIKATPSGTLAWVSNYSGYGMGVTNGSSIQVTEDGGFVFAGGTHISSPWPYTLYAYLMRFENDTHPLDVNISPVNPPIIIPANGGNFQYNCNVHVLTTQPQTFSLWNKVRAGTTYYPVFGPVTRTLPGGANPTRILTQTIAGTIPSGTLTFISYVGTYPNIISDSSFFTITKLTTSDGGPWISESTCEGDFFDEFGDGSAMVSSGSGATPTILVSPNPFNPTTTFTFTLPEAAKVTLEVFDIGGRVVSGKHGGLPHQFEAGTHEITFDGSDLPSGVYLYRLEAGENVVAGKLVLLK